MRESLRRSLSFNGYSVELAQDGVEALDAITNNRPDALILDVMMPRLDGLEELLARMRALLRRTVSDDSGDSQKMTFSDLTLDPVTREVTRGGRQISLTRTEFSLLEMLIANPRRVLTRSRILEEVWGFDFPTSGNALEVYIGYLRRKTEAEGEPRLIHTVRGVGYVLRETPP